MKTLFSCAAIALCIAISDPASAQSKMNSSSINERSVPESVRSNFNQTNPNTRAKEWKRVEKDGQTMYKAKFDSNNQEHYAVYDESGNLKKTKREVSRNEVPQSVWSSLQNSEHANWKVDEIKEIRSKEHGTLYSIEVEQGRNEKKLIYSPDGTLSKVRDDD